MGGFLPVLEHAESEVAVWVLGKGLLDSLGTSGLPWALFGGALGPLNTQVLVVLSVKSVLPPDSGGCSAYILEECVVAWADFFVPVK